MQRMRAILSAVAVAASLAAVAACDPNTPIAGTATTTSAGVGAKLVAVQNDTLGGIVADEQGRTLYRFDKDTAKPPKSNCDGDCAKNWPPVVVSSAADVLLEGVQQSDVSTVERTDGKRQLTIAGWPVYRYSGDKTAGDTKGQGVGKTWYAVTPLGKKAVATTPPPTTGGY